MHGLKDFCRRFNNAMDAGLGIILLKLMFGLIMIGVVTNVIPEFVRGLLTAQDGKAGAETSAQSPLPVPGRVKMRSNSMQTRHLHIRPFTLEDAEAYWPLVSLPEVLRYTGEQPHASVDEVAETLRSRPLRDYAVYGFGRMACIEKSSGRLVGFSGLKYLEDLGDVDIGYRFLPDCWGKGYATESAQAVLGTAGEHGISRIIGLVEPENGASARVLEKLGLVFERHIQPEGCTQALRQFATPGTGPGDAFKPRSIRGLA